MGTPEFAVPSLERLFTDGHDICGVFTREDKPKGRGMTLTQPPVKGKALTLGFEVFQPAGFRDGSAEEIIKDLQPELIAVVAYGRILPQSVLGIPSRGCVNVHASLLPKYRGAAPIQWAIANGERVTGVTTQLIAAGIDVGDVLLREETPIGGDEDAEALAARLSLMGAELLSRTVAGIAEESVHPIPQEDALATHAPILTKEDGMIDWGRPASDIHCLVRGMRPWPSAWTKLGGNTLKVHAAGVCEGLGRPGQILRTDSDGLEVACGQGSLLITSLQAEGGRRMDAGEYLRGHALPPGQILG